MTSLIEVYLTADFTGLTASVLDGPMSADERDLESLQAIVDRIGCVNTPLNLLVVARLIARGWLRIHTQILPAGFRALENVSCEKS